MILPWKTTEETLLKSEKNPELNAERINSSLYAHDLKILPFHLNFSDLLVNIIHYIRRSADIY